MEIDMGIEMEMALPCVEAELISFSDDEANGADASTLASHTKLTHPASPPLLDSHQVDIAHPISLDALNPNALALPKTKRATKMHPAGKTAEKRGRAKSAASPAAAGKATAAKRFAASMAMSPTPAMLARVNPIPDAETANWGDMVKRSESMATLG